MKFRKAIFVDLWEAFYDRHPIYALNAILAKHSVEIEFAFSRNRLKILKKLRDFEPDLIMYSAFSAHVPLFAEFDRIVKKEFPSAFSMIGGPGVNDKASHLYLMKSTIDAACIGEGDLAIEDFLTGGGACSRNLIPAQDLGKPHQFNRYVELDRLPFPNREPVYVRDRLRAEMPSKQFMGSRGCPYKCTYCHNHLEHELFKGCGRTVRLKSVDYLITEIKELRKKYPVKTAVFQDDIFFVNKKWGTEFCEKFPRAVGIPFTCNVRSNLIDEDVVRSLKEGGCAAVAWAIESGDPSIRNEVLQRNMTDEGILRAAELFNQYGIKHRVNNVIGIPGESFEQMLKTLELNMRAKPFLSSAHIFIPFQGLKLTEQAISQGYLSPDEVKALPNSFADETVLNFSKEDKLKIKKLSLLFPIFTRFPALYRNKWIFDRLFALPVSILKLIYQPVHLISWSGMYRVSAGISVKVRLFLRYFSYGT